MIIKSMSRKNASFAQLFDYINAHDEVPYFVSWNLNLTNHRDRNRVISQFYENSKHLNFRKNGNALYHEIISLKYFSDVSLERQMKALHDLTTKYLQARGNQLLSYGRMHLSQGHLHFHVMLSSNELQSSRRHRLSTSEFNQIRIQCEQYLFQNYPDLKQPVIYDREQRPRLSKTKQREYEFKKRTGSETKKEKVKKKLLDLLAKTPRQGLEGSLKLHRFELYRRGQTWGVIYEEKKYRLSTLGLERAFHEALEQKEKPSSASEASDIETSEEPGWAEELEDYYRRLEREEDGPDFNL